MQNKTVALHLKIVLGRILNYIYTFLFEYFIFNMKHEYNKESKWQKEHKQVEKKELNYSSTMFSLPMFKREWEEVKTYQLPPPVFVSITCIVISILLP